jgi:hypothetical protein
LIHEEIVPLIPKLVHIKPKESIPNILLNSVSYLNFERHLPLKKKFVQNHKFYELKGYNKVGANTWPNMIQFLTGLFANELVPGIKRGKSFFDNWPLIWKKFRNKEFCTLFIEEMAKHGLFNWEKKGFKT